MTKDVKNSIRGNRASTTIHDIESIGPRLALAYLEDANVNRRVSEPAVVKYAEAMRRSQWTLGQPIMFDQFGQLVDGQHRLHAVIRANIPVRFNVLRGVEAIRHIDAGRSRSPADVLQMMGYKNSNILAALTRLVLYTEKNPKGSPIASGSGMSFITIDDIIDRVENDSFLEVAASMAGGKYKPLSSMVRSAALVGWFIYTLHNHMEDDQLMIDFMEEAVGRAPSVDDNPANVLYRTLNNPRTDQRRLGKNERAALLVKAWNAYFEQRPIKRLFYRAFGSRAEQFPKLLTDIQIGGKEDE